jgi:hypothetical protein
MQKWVFFIFWRTEEFVEQRVVNELNKKLNDERSLVMQLKFRIDQLETRKPEEIKSPTASKEAQRNAKEVSGDIFFQFIYLLISNITFKRYFICQ